MEALELQTEEDRRAKHKRLARYAAYLGIFFLWVLLIFYATRSSDRSSWLTGWQRWDARWYEQIWREGYPVADPRTLVFPPGYPLAIGALAKLFFQPFLATAVVLNLAALFAAAVLISEWFSRKFRVSAYLVFCFALSTPAAYFAFTAYSDLLFMLLLWFLLWIALSAANPSRKRTLIAESSLLFALPWIRLVGYALASWLFARRATALAVLASLALWLGFNRLITGNAFYFLHAQELFAMPQGTFVQGLADSLQHFASDLRDGHAMTWLEFGCLPLVYLVALTTAAIWLAKRREGLLALTVLSLLALSYNQGFWRSVVRYDLPLTPVLCLPLLVASESRPRMTSYLYKGAFYALTIAQFSLQIYFARIFHSGEWAF